MGLFYDLYVNPPQKEEGGKQTLHARVVTSETVETNAVAEIIADRSTIRAGEVKATLDLLSEVLVWELSQGRRVHLDGLGYFQLSLSCPCVESEKEIRSESLSVRSVVFRPDQALKNKVKLFKLTRAPGKKLSKRKSLEEIVELLINYFKKAPYLSSRDFARLAGLPHSTGKLRIQQLIKEGKLKRIGQRNSSLYMAGEALK